MAQTAVMERPDTAIMPFAEQPLTVVNQALVSKELGLDKEKLPTEEEKKMEAYAVKLASELLSGDLKDPATRNLIVQKIDGMGNGVLRQARVMSEMLKAPMRKLAESGDEGGVVAKSILELKVQMEEIDPGNFDFQPGWLGRTLSRLPFIGSPLNRYISRYDSAEAVIQSIIRNIDNGIEEMKNDNQTMKADQGRWRDNSRQLMGYIKLAETLDKAFEAEMKKYPADSDEYKFIGEEVVFTTRQKIQTYQKSLADFQLGFSALEVIIRNNRELVRGADGVVSSLQITLNVAATVAMGVAKQKRVGNAIKSARDLGERMRKQAIGQVATQGVELQKDLSNMNSNVDELKQSLTTLKSAFEQISTFRLNALEPMKASIQVMDQFHQDAEALISRIERGNQLASNLEIQLPQ